MKYFSSNEFKVCQSVLCARNHLNAKKIKKQKLSLIKGKNGRNIRLMIYQYLNLNCNLIKISKLSKSERESLKSLKHHLNFDSKERSLRIRIKKQSVNCVEQISTQYLQELTNNFTLVVNVQQIKIYNNFIKSLKQNRENNIYLEGNNADRIDGLKDLGFRKTTKNKQINYIKHLKLKQCRITLSFLQQQIDMSKLDIIEIQYSQIGLRYKNDYKKKSADPEFINKMQSQTQVLPTKILKLNQCQMIDSIWFGNMPQLEEVEIKDCEFNDFSEQQTKLWTNLKKLTILNLKNGHFNMMRELSYKWYRIISPQNLSLYHNLQYLKITCKNIDQLKDIHNSMKNRETYLNLRIITTFMTYLRDLAKIGTFPASVKAKYICPALSIFNQKNCKLPDNFIFVDNLSIQINQYYLKYCSFIMENVQTLQKTNKYKGKIAFNQVLYKIPDERIQEYQQFLQRSKNDKNQRINHGNNAQYFRVVSKPFMNLEVDFKVFA